MVVSVGFGRVLRFAGCAAPSHLSLRHTPRQSACRHTYTPYPTSPGKRRKSTPYTFAACSPEAQRHPRRRLRDCRLGFCGWSTRPRPRRRGYRKHQVQFEAWRWPEEESGRIRSSAARRSALQGVHQWRLRRRPARLLPEGLRREINQRQR